MRKSLLFASAAFAVASCANPNAANPADPLFKLLSRISATADADLVAADAVAKAATPPDVDGHNCIAAIQAVGASVKSVVAAANVPGASVITAAEMATLFRPGSPQYSLATSTINSGCAAKAVATVGPAALVGAGVVGAVASGQVVPVLAAGA